MHEFLSDNIVFKQLVNNFSGFFSLLINTSLFHIQVTAYMICSDLNRWRCRVKT